MRRQVKPFVTEYRGTPRRTKDLPAGADAYPDNYHARNRSYAEAQKVFQSEPTEDTYEAALRAADALFASERAEPPSATTEVPATAPPLRGISPQPTEAAIDQLFTLPVLQERFVETTPRRILQAIEPLHDDRFAALEAERAPKRRGRKPGSKNKPKIAVGDDWSAAMQPAAGTVPATRPKVAADIEDAASRFVLADFIQGEVDEPQVSEPEVEKSPYGELEIDPADNNDALPPPPRGRTDRFGWKRDGLRPGERWKRRLPKAAR